MNEFSGAPRQTRRTILKGAVGLAALGLGASVDVADRRVDLGERAAVAHGQELGVGPAPGAVGAAQAHGDRHALVVVREPLQGRDERGGVAGVHEIRGACARELRGWDVE